MKEIKGQPLQVKALHLLLKEESHNFNELFTDLQQCRLVLMLLIASTHTRLRLMSNVGVEENETRNFTHEKRH